MNRKFLLLSFLLFFKISVFAQPGALDVTFNPNDIGFGSGIGVDGRNDDIRSILIGSEGNIFLGGSFDRYNEIYTPGFIQVRNDGFRTFLYKLPTTIGNGISEVNTMVEVDGAVLIGGRLNYWANNLGTQRQYYGIARVSKFGDFESTSFISGIVDDCTINSMVKESNGLSVIVAGSFTYYNGQKFVSGLGRFQGSWDPFFNPETGTGGMSAVALQSDGQILVAGWFNFTNGLPQYGIARLNTNGSIDNSFNPGTVSNGEVTNILVQNDGKIIITGGFTSYNGTPRNGIVRINSNGSIDNTFGNSSIGTNAYIGGAALQTDGKVVIGGYFPSLPGITNFKNSVIRINNNGTIDNSFTSGNTMESENIKSITIQSDGKILVGGQFTYYNNKPLNDVIRLNSNGTHDPTFNPSTGVVGPRPINISINTMNVQPDNKIIIGGKFNSYNGNSHNNLLRINPDGSSDGTFTSGIPDNLLSAFNYIVTSALQTDGKVVVGGSFVLPGRSAPSSLARLNSNGSIDNTFNPGNIASGNTNQFLILQNGKILVSGDSTSNIGERFFYLVRLNTNGSIDNTFNAGAGANSVINEIATQSDGKIVIAGYFTTFNGTACNYITRLNADGNLDNSFVPGTGANSGIDELLIQSDGKILIGGIFTSYNGTTRNYLARLNADGSLDNTFNIGTGPGAPIIEMALQLDNKLLISGNFTTYNGTTSNRIARINTDGTIDNIFQSGTGPSWGISSMVVQPDERILIGGVFSSYNNIGRNRIARLLKCEPDVITLTSAANTNNQSVCSGIPITNITYTITGATGASITGLPAGITGNYNNGTYTISGSSTVAGIYNYTLSSTGGCSVTVTGTIIIRPTNTVSSASASPTVCINTLIVPITHNTTNATGIGTPINLPPGVSAGWLNNKITISGAPSAIGTFNYSILLTGGCGNISATGTIKVNPLTSECFPTSVTNYETKENVQIYPNPILKGKNVQALFKNKRAGIYNISITNISGILVGSMKISHAGGSTTHTIPLNNDLKTGTYILRIVNEKNEREVFKLKIGQ